MQEEVGRVKNGRWGGWLAQVLDAGDCLCPGETRARGRSSVSRSNMLRFLRCSSYIPRLYVLGNNDIRPVFIQFCSQEMTD